MEHGCQSGNNQMGQMYRFTTPIQRPSYNLPSSDPQPFSPLYSIQYSIVAMNARRRIIFSDDANGDEKLISFNHGSDSKKVTAEINLKRFNKESEAVPPAMLSSENSSMNLKMEATRKKLERRRSGE